MANKLAEFWGRLLFQRELGMWRRWARDSDRMSRSRLRKISKHARQLRAQIDRIAHAAEDRLNQPRTGSNATPTQLHSDWSWRPKLWRNSLDPSGISSARNKARLGTEARVFHDCGLNELTIRQMRNRRKTDLAPFGLRLDVFSFEGSFLSVVIDLPQDAVEAVKQTHIVRLDALVKCERPIEIFARLNVKHGPNTENIVRELPLNDDDVTVEFDLSYTSMNEKRVERMWVDLIFEKPAMNQIEIRDLTFSRRPRTQI